MISRATVAAVVVAVAIAGVPGLPDLPGVRGAATPASAASSIDLVWDHVFSGEENVHSSPTVADVDGDGSNDVVFATQAGWVRAFDADGESLPGWPQRVRIGGAPTGVDAPVTVADIDGDGFGEVIVGAGLLSNPSQHGGLVVFEHDGSKRFTFRTGDERVGPDGFSDGVFNAPAVGDVTGDGHPDIVFGSFDRRVHALDRNGGVIGSFFTEDTIFSSPALFDVDRDGRDEIFIGGDSSAAGDVATHDGGILWSLEVRDGDLVRRWRRDIGEIIVSSPAIGDVDRDGRMEVVFGTGDFFDNADSRRVFAVDIEDGSNAPGWPQPTSGKGWSSPALADLDGDGGLDVTIGDRSGRLHAWKGDGTKLWEVDPSDGTPFTAGVITSGPTVADVDGNGTLEVLIATGNAVFARSGKSGALVDRFATNWQYQTSPALGRFDGSWRLVAAGYLDAEDESRIAVYDIPKPGTGSPWPMFSRDAHHRGAPAAAIPEPGAKAGYWLLDVAGDVYAFGDAGHFGSMETLQAANPETATAPAAGIVPTTSGEGYWVLDRFGGIFTFGDADFFGSVPELRSSDPSIGDAPVIGLSPTPTDDGYWLLDDQGGIFTFGDAAFFGSLPALRDSGASIGSADVVTIASTPSGDGYWVLDELGGMFAFGDAAFFGSVPGLRDQGISVGPARIVGMAPTPTGDGYWMVDEFGGMFAFGDAAFFGSIPDLRNQGVAVGPATIVAFVPTPTGEGYWLVDDRGGIFAFGDAAFFGSLPGVGAQTTVAGMAPS